MNCKEPWRNLGRRSRLLLVGILCCFICFWLTIMSTDGYNIFDNLDVDKDPVFLPVERRRSLSNKTRLNETMLARFPVIPLTSIKTKVTPSPLREDEVIPNAANFTHHLSKILTSYTRKDIIVSVVDYGFSDVALNFIQSSIKPLHLEDVLFLVCLDIQSVNLLRSYGYKCLLLDIVYNETYRASDFGSKEYYRKTNIKTWVALQFLKFNRTILLSDVDVALFKNPFPYFSCTFCDIHIQMDRDLYNSGFVYVKANHSSLVLYENAWRLYLQYHTGHDQAYVNMAIRELDRKNALHIKELPSRNFPCGVYYFEYGYRHFYNIPSCLHCVMAHNNYMGTTAAKVYRFKENLLWTLDKNAYYSDTKAKYLTYENPYDFGKATIEIEQRALISALVIGNTTNRIVILPSFRCCNCRTKSCDHPKNRCSLLSVVQVKRFDQFFSGRYREHSFLRNALVPASVKRDLSPIIYLNTSLPNHADISMYITGNTTRPKMEVFDFNQNPPKISTLLGVLNRFSSYQVLRFHSLYTQFNFEDVRDRNGSSWLDDFRSGIRCAVYQQWEMSLEEKFFGKTS